LPNLFFLQARFRASEKATFTYNSPDKHLEGKQTGGYSTSVVVDENLYYAFQKI
jgi:hypothetical protein